MWLWILYLHVDIGKQNRNIATNASNSFIFSRRRRWRRCLWTAVSRPLTVIETAQTQQSHWSAWLINVISIYVCMFRIIFQFTNFRYILVFLSSEVGLTCIRFFYKLCSTVIYWLLGIFKAVSLFAWGMLVVLLFSNCPKPV